MLWDHLDLAPIYAGWQDGTLARTGFLRIHGGHLHTAAYVVLLLTTRLSHGQTWLDCVVSWMLLICYAGIVFAIARRTLPMENLSGRLTATLIVFLLLYPGHLANLQWGWQVAVFLCLFGSAVAIACLTAERLTWAGNLTALAATGIALLSFATGLALVPIALIALTARSELRMRERLSFLIPWLLVCAVAVWAASSTAHVLAHFSAESIALAWAKLKLWTVVLYTLNYLGAGIGRFVPAVAPWLAVVAIVSGLAAICALRRRRSAWPWAAFFLFGVGSAVLTALARFSEGDAQAFAARYVSFSSLFWIGWIALCFLWAEVGRSRIAARVPILFGIIAMLAAANALQMTRESAKLGAETRVLAQTICVAYPQIDESVLSGMYYGGPEAALEHLHILRRFGFAPFDDCNSPKKDPD